LPGALDSFFFWQRQQGPTPKNPSRVGVCSPVLPLTFFPFFTATLFSHCWVGKNRFPRSSFFCHCHPRLFVGKRKTTFMACLFFEVFLCRAPPHPLIFFPGGLKTCVFGRGTLCGILFPFSAPFLGFIFPFLFLLGRGVACRNSGLWARGPPPPCGFFFFFFLVTLSPFRTNGIVRRGTSSFFFCFFFLSFNFFFN